MAKISGYKIACSQHFAPDQHIFFFLMDYMNLREPPGGRSMSLILLFIKCQWSYAAPVRMTHRWIADVLFWMMREKIVTQK